MCRLAGARLSVNHSLYRARGEGEHAEAFTPDARVFLVFASVPLAAVPAFWPDSPRSRARAPAASAAVHETGLDLSAHEPRGRSPALTSSSLPAAAGSRTIRFRPIARAGAASTSCRNITYEILRRMLETAASGGDAAAKKIGDYYAACMDERADREPGSRRRSRRTSGASRRSAEVGGSAGAPRRPAHESASPHSSRFGARSRFQGRDDRDRHRRSGRARPARTATTTSATMRGRPTFAASTWSTSQTMLGLARRDAGARQPQRRRPSMRARDGAGQGRARQRVAAGSRQGLPSHDAGRAAGADAVLRLARVLPRRRRAAVHGDQRHRAGLLQGLRPAARGDARWTTSRPTFAGSSFAPTRPCCRRRSSTRTSASTANAAGHDRAAAALEAMRAVYRHAISAKRSARRSSRRLRRRTKGRHARDGPRRSSRRWSATSTTLPWMTDDTKKQALAKLHAIVEQDRLSGSRGATTAPCGSSAATPLGQRASGERVRVPAAPEQDRQAGRQERMEHDAADGQRVLQPAREQHQLPCRHPAAALLRRLGRCRGQFRRRRRRDRPRADPRLRRPGPAVRRARAT